MKRLLATTVFLVLAPAMMSAQTDGQQYRPQGYVFMGEGSDHSPSSGTRNNAQVGAGAEVLVIKGFGVGGEFGEIGRGRGLQQAASVAVCPCGLGSMRFEQAASVELCPCGLGSMRFEQAARTAGSKSHPPLQFQTIPTERSFGLRPRSCRFLFSQACLRKSESSPQACMRTSESAPQSSIIVPVHSPASKLAADL